jgi:hypothetical protein
MFDVVLITGAAGTGKTSTARAWAASRRGVAAHVSHDDVLLFTKSGLASPAEQTTAEAERQWRIHLRFVVQQPDFTRAIKYAVQLIRFLFQHMWISGVDLHTSALVWLS